MGRTLGVGSAMVAGIIVILCMTYAPVTAMSAEEAREKKVTIDQVPEKVKAAILEAVGEGRLVDIGVFTHEGGKSTYEIEMVVGGKEFDVLFDSDGKVLKKTFEGYKSEGKGKKGEEGTEEAEEEREEAGEEEGKEQGKSVEEAVAQHEIPKAVMDALLAKFPKAKIDKCTKEKEGGDIVYDMEFKQEGRKCEADIKENGIYINYEKAIEAKALPEAVSEAIAKRYPNSAMKEVMEETEVKGKKEKLSAYEVVLETADKKEVEVRVSPKGKILEDTGTTKPKERKKPKEKKK